MKWTHAAPRAARGIGCRGTYTIEVVGGRYTLKGVGHDQLPMLPLPRQFITSAEARDHAERLDHVTDMEPQASGA
jgi:hypothetical protein